MLENTPAHLLKEVVIIDDQSTIPVAGWENDSRVRIIRSSDILYVVSLVETNLGLINARILGGNEAHGDFLAFIDAHVFVSPRWLNTPYRFLMEVVDRLESYCRIPKPLSILSTSNWTQIRIVQCPFIRESEVRLLSHGLLVSSGVEVLGRMIIHQLLWVCSP